MPEYFVQVIKVSFLKTNSFVNDQSLKLDNFISGFIHLKEDLDIVLSTFGFCKLDCIVYEKEKSLLVKLPISLYPYTLLLLAELWSFIFWETYLIKHSYV